MRTERRKIRSIAETIVSLGEEAGCILLVSPNTLTAVPRPGVLRFLSAHDVMRHGGAAVEEFSRVLSLAGATHPNLALAVALYACLAALCSQCGAVSFDGVGQTPDEIRRFFDRQHSNPRPLHNDSN